MFLASHFVYCSVIFFINLGSQKRSPIKYILKNNYLILKKKCGMEREKYLQFPKVITVRAIEKYKIFLKYDDGTEGILDLSDAAGKGVFKYWDINDNFFKVYIDKETDGIAWSNELD